MDFYQELTKLIQKKPRNQNNSRAITNSDFCDYISQSKNCYVSFFTTEGQDCFYAEYLTKCRDCVDSTYLTNSELCYECSDCSNLYNCSFLQDCHQCANCDFCYDCHNCKDCFGSFGLRHKQFCVFNVQYSEEDYYKKVAEFRKHPVPKILSILQPEFDKHPRLFARRLKGGEHSLGDYIYFSKNCYQCFNVQNLEEALYVTDSIDPAEPSHDCVDCTYLSGSELCYECDNISGCSNCNFLQNCTGCSDSEYLVNCTNCQNCLGCVYLSNKEYCILNRQCTREEYLTLSKQIKAQLKEKKQHGKSLADLLLRR